MRSHVSVLIFCVAASLPTSAQISIDSVRQSSNCAVAGVIGNVVLNCANFSPEQNRALNEFFKQPLTAINARYDARIQEQGVQIQKLEKDANEWKDRYVSLSERLADINVGDARREKAQEFLKAGKLAEAEGLLR